MVRAELAGSGNHPGLWHAVEHADGTWTSELVVAAPSDIVGPDLAIGPDDAVHIAFVRTDAGNEGVYDATNETGSWVVTLVAPLAADAGVGAARVQVSTAGDVDVAWAGPDGVFDATRTGGTWAAPVEVSPDRAASLDLVRDGGTLHLVFGRTNPFDEPDGIEYATSAGGPWSVETLDAGVDASPRLAVDADGHAHVTYLRASPEPQVRYATDATGSWVTDVVTESWTWLDPSFAVDAAGHHHVAVARQGTEPGLWYGTDAGGSWSMERLTTIAPDGGVGLVVAPDGSASIAYGESIDGTEAQVAEQTAWLATGTPGAWTFTQLATEATTGTHAIARAADGTLHVAFGINDGGERRIAYATDALGSWVVAPIGASSALTADDNPSIAVDAHGHAHIAFEAAAMSPDRTSIFYATNASGFWVISRRTTGAPHDLGPSIALDSAGRPRIAYLRQGIGVRAQLFSGSTWTTKTVSSNGNDTGPSIAIDAAGHTHVLYAGGGLRYEVCGVPLCSGHPGLRWWNDAPGAGSARRVTDFGDDVSPSLVRGPDGSLSAAFVNTGWRLAEIRLTRPLARVSAPVAHLAGAGTKLDKGTAGIAVTFAGTGAATYRLQDSVNGGGYSTVGPVRKSTSRTILVAPGSSITHRLRVVPYDAFGVQGFSTAGTVFRVATKNEAATGALHYAGTWSTSTNAGFGGGKARHASSSNALATFAFTGREVAWVAAKGANRGHARVYVDGVLRTTVDLQAASTKYRRVVFRATWSASGAHTISIRPVGDGRVDLDGFERLR